MAKTKTPPREPKPTDSQLAIRIGDPVNVVDDQGHCWTTYANSDPWQLGHGTWVIKVVPAGPGGRDGRGVGGASGYALHRVTPRTVFCPTEPAAGTGPAAPPRVRWVKGGTDKGKVVLQLSESPLGGGRRLWIETTPEAAGTLVELLQELIGDLAVTPAVEAEGFTFDAGEIA